MKPIIGVIPLWDGAKNSIWMLPGYLDVIREAGAIPVIFPLKASRDDIEQLCGVCSGFLLTGGDDVDPMLYGEVKSDRCGEPNVVRDTLEREVFDYAMQRDMPVFGICRGIQFINAVLGGTLYQDLPSQYSPKVEAERGGVCHQMTPPYDRVCHRVKVLEGSPLYNIVGVEDLGVNSYHHQAIKELSPRLKAMAISEDGLVEAVYMPDMKFVQAVQWHPELNYLVEESSRGLMREFVSHCSCVEL